MKFIVVDCFIGVLTIEDFKNPLHIDSSLCFAKFRMTRILIYHTTSMGDVLPQCTRECNRQNASSL
ncbi:hypothetical protein [Helicobacter sp. MIT 14-3879]|uniref:hypothetical protein n=1 Tax=Helicobacter sp. MIT 14-3879 TaxID=2040649 RepID=UPI0011C05C7A|nr:hypothetical protein [Helicobacter sp. MIT 14-3879]